MPVPDSSGSDASTPAIHEPDGQVASPRPAATDAPPSTYTGGGLWGWLRAQQQRTADLRKRLASLGLAAALSYGIFDAMTYTIAFSLAFLGYEARTGLNPTQNVADIVKICILMWAGNNVTRPFRLAGAAALAPFMDRLMERLQGRLGLKSKAGAFAILVTLIAGLAFSIQGGLFLSRWVRG
ncbi:hypothetical protein CHLNCDRAFT_133767 [Chlorella variabilis]|uniref:Uncharacterized protein n=1 Tax=Chlorella variabilis TaxID=554065 RepID=E1ZF70_CHLVA|nr:hypothetical protein CHLNCDRAFT_133767 [Chlorella variabilis]EFN55448.1 hypothetical protein CHLNCDRAFT_133767 [Chlorella variabilis]|eukprot:XP_005847550.1 hypothetical protein CHLNCDRAFT_133767 [Chlorella variabilis]